MTPANVQTEVPLNDTGLPLEGVISDSVHSVLEPAILSLMLPFNVLGVITNIINIRVFLKQGVRHDSTNISLVCLSFFDLIGCTSMLPYPCCFFFKYTKGVGEYLFHSCYGPTQMIIHAHIPAQQIGAWITVYVSVIRSLCVLFPLKIKLLITPTLTIIVIMLITIFFASFQIQFVGYLALALVFSPEFNTSFYTIIVSPKIQPVLYFKHLITNQILPAIAVVVVSTNTALMGRKLLHVKKWRLQHSSEPTKTSTDSHLEKDSNSNSNANTKPLASKEIELIKMVNAVTSIFLVCFLMGFVPSIPIMVLPGVFYGGINENLFKCVYLFRYLFDVINSSINFFFYIRVSSRYKAAFAASFPACARTK